MIYYRRLLETLLPCSIPILPCLQVENQVGVIHPDTDVEAVVRHAYNNARLLCQKCYLTAPELELKSHNVTCPQNRLANAS